MTWPLPPFACCAGYATVDRAEQLVAPTPVLGKLPGQEPLVGNAKVRLEGVARKGGGGEGGAACSPGPGARVCAACCAVCTRMPMPPSPRS